MLLGAIGLVKIRSTRSRRRRRDRPVDVARVALREHLHALTVNHELVPSTTTSPGKRPYSES